MTTQHPAERTVPVERLRLGDHACMGPGDLEGAGESPWKVFTAYTRTSLARGEKVLLVMDPDDMSDDEVVALLDRGSGQVAAARDDGQLSVRRNTEIYVPDGRFEERRTIDTYAAEVDRACDDGWAGLRVTADMSWAPRVNLGHDRLLDYEASVAPLFADPLFTAICWYDRQRFDDALTSRVGKVHPLRVMERLDSLEVIGTPDGGRMAGTAELGTRSEFVEALREALEHRDDSGPSHFVLDLRDLCFMEAHCAWQLISLAASLPPGSEVTVRCGELLGLVLEQLGADEVPQLLVRVEGDGDEGGTG
ncbi:MULTISPECIES: MEDS domain-containing protein [Streptomyces]|uniref:MEDS domain-containing protein n=1 Tax=Streptomyces caniscabiei TaxID=2746961 RepID=A0ABU4MPP5_9ACTN|nr:MULTISPECIES: MEDS domain-containing protein [Streptomyces]MBE4737857.1 MEDS domain-containing protein [Streptomyces caniscabiei]MBE4757344.1 MEDS domain-containing protein [Streptomyces caniscabiei]MBE4769343.1 MEDS domain-containing protein [Streptomyces caniscabiei]MBE4784936.1 MEDS domain-containing protein [Streptomyces caniscabiei]MBE4795720.1 MEDS domain-containing protein [Streptomyces caniscabiei]